MFLRYVSGQRDDTDTLLIHVHSFVSSVKAQMDTVNCGLLSLQCLPTAVV